MRPKQFSNHYAIIVNGKIIEIIPKGDLYKKEKKRLADVSGVHFRLATLPTETSSYLSRSFIPGDYSQFFLANNKAI